MCCSARVGKAAEPPKWIKPQLTRNGMNRLRATIGCTRSSNDSYRMHARLEGGNAWQDRAQTPVGYPMVNVRDIESGKVRVTRDLFGAD